MFLRLGMGVFVQMAGAHTLCNKCVVFWNTEERAANNQSFNPETVILVLKILFGRPTLSNLVGGFLLTCSG